MSRPPASGFRFLPLMRGASMRIVVTGLHVERDEVVFDTCDVRAYLRGILGRHPALGQAHDHSPEPADLFAEALEVAPLHVGFFGHRLDEDALAGVSDQDA